MGPTTVQVVASQTHVGPLPSPADLAKYKELSPDLLDRIVGMAEREQAARLNGEDMAVRADIRNRDAVLEAQREHARGVFRSDLVGQVLGWLLAIFATAGAIYLAWAKGLVAVPVALVGLPIAAIIRAIRQGGTRPPAASAPADQPKQG